MNPYSGLGDGYPDDFRDRVAALHHPYEFHTVAVVDDDGVHDTAIELPDGGIVSTVPPRIACACTARGLLRWPCPHLRLLLPAETDCRCEMGEYPYTAPATHPECFEHGDWRAWVPPAELIQRYNPAGGGA